MARESTTLWVSVSVAFIVIAGLWYYSTQLEPDQPTLRPEQQRQAPAAEPAAPSGPLFPMSEPVERPDLRPLPALDDSDEFLRLELSDLYGQEFAALLAESRVIERIVATVDNLPRRHVAERMRPVAALSDPFVAEQTGNEDEYILSDEGFHRYDALIDMLSSVDTGSIVSIYRRYYPLFQDAYAELGYPDGYFNDRLVEVIDHLLAAPRREGPIYLRRTHVLYEFANPDLEELSSGRKLLLRMGPENADAVKARLAELRAAISGETER